MMNHDKIGARDKIRMCLTTNLIDGCLNQSKNRNLTRRFFTGLVLLLISGGLIACQSVSNEAETVPEARAIAGEPAGESNHLVIYSGRNESLVGPVIDQFETASGIDVDVRYGGTAELAGVLLEEGSNSPADIFYAQDPGGLGAVQTAGLLAPLPPTTLELVPERFASEAGEWIGVSGRARTVVYNTAAITDPASQLPDDLWGFTDPAWQGRLGWAPTNGSFQAMITAMRAIWGDEKTGQWLQGIQANDPAVFDSNTPIVAAVGRGEIEAGFVNHYYLYRFLSEEGQDFAARNYFLPGGGPGSLIMVSGAGILKSAANPENAQKFIDFLLSLPTQQYFAAQTFEYPLIEGANTVSGLVPLAELDAQAANIDLSQLADLAGTQKMLLDLGIID
jgi:iron(III) transport system substrate-binding protein